jgi:uncharacterized membrane protein YedE/YeeE
MPDFLIRPWPWYIGGPIIGLMVPALLLLGNKSFGFSSNLRHICAACFPSTSAFLRYDWKRTGGWNLAFLAGTLIGGFIGGRLLATGSVALSATTRAALTALGLHDLSGLVPREVFSWAALATPRGIVMVVVGGFLVGFGTAYAGGCTSGHAISGLADFQKASLVAVIGFFAGGLIATFVLLPLLF